MKMIAFDEALARVLDVANPLGTQKLEVAEACGRILSAPVIARADTPNHDVSAMDGYALREADTGAIPFSLPVIGESFAGSDPSMVLEPGCMCRIFTGAPVPAEADLVIIQENIDRDGDVATVARPYGPGRHIRKAGSDFRAGDVLLPKGHRLTWKSLTTAAAADHAQVEVYRAPRVAILATGDELASPGEAHLKPGSIPESVSLAIGALVREHGADLIRSQRFPDEPDQLGAAAKAALEEADLVIAIGGASVGERDYSRDMFGRSLDYIFPKVAMKPGKPVWMAKAGARFIVGLPGNPTSALVTARLLLVPLLEGLSGASAQAALQFRREMCRDALPQCGGREAFLRAIRTPDGLVLANSQDSSSQQVLALADVLIRRAAHAEATEPGAMVEIVDF